MNSVNIWKFIIKMNLSSSMSLEWIQSLELFNFWWLALTGVEKSVSHAHGLLWYLSDKELVDSIRFLLQAIMYWLPWNERFLFSLISFFLLSVLYNASKVPISAVLSEFKLPFLNFTDDVSILFREDPDNFPTPLREAFDCYCSLK